MQQATTTIAFMSNALVLAFREGLDATTRPAHFVAHETALRVSTYCTRVDTTLAGFRNEPYSCPSMLGFSTWGTRQATPLYDLCCYLPKDVY